jgi:Lon-like ATP-dependent protease
LNDLTVRLFASALHLLSRRGQAAALERAISLFLGYYDRREAELLPVLQRFAGDSRWVLRYIAGREIGRFIDLDAAQTAKVWMRLAADPTLYVREGTAKGVVRAAEADMERVWRAWADAFDHADDRVRQTAAMTLMGLSPQLHAKAEIRHKAQKMADDASPKVRAVYDHYVAPRLVDGDKEKAGQPDRDPAARYATTAELPVPTQLIEQVVGQDEAVEIIRLAARQGRSVLLIGEPGTGKSMLGKAMAELMPGSGLEDVIIEAGERGGGGVPKVRVLPAGEGGAYVDKFVRELRGGIVSFRWIMGFACAVSLFVALFYTYTRNEPLYLIGGVFAVAFIIWFSRTMKADPLKRAPKCLVNNAGKRLAPFIDATGLQAGALLGDVRHDPYQSGGMESRPHRLVEPGAIHCAHKGVLFVDEASTLSLESQQALLTAFQEKRLSVTGRSPGSSGTMVRTESVPSDFIMVLAGNVQDVEKLHPALRSRIRGYGYEVYMNDTMPDTVQNRFKLAQFVAQEVRKDGKIPHFTCSAVHAVIARAGTMAERPGRLTAHFRELGGLIRAAGDAAVQAGSAFVEPQHVHQAMHTSRTLEQQMRDREHEVSAAGRETVKAEGVYVGKATANH